MTPFKGIHQVEALLICTCQGNWIISEYYQEKYWDFRPSPGNNAKGDIIGMTEVRPGIRITYEWIEEENRLIITWNTSSYGEKTVVRDKIYKVVFEDGLTILLDTVEGVPLRYILHL